MPIVSPAAPVTTFLDIIRDAFIEIGVIAAGEPLEQTHAAYGGRKLNRLVDGWNADEMYIFAKVFATYAIPTNAAPNADASVSFTIGPATNLPAPVFAVPQGTRPVRIAAANIILNTVTPPVKSRLEIRDRAWWSSQRVPGITSQIPTDLYYEPSWPLGTIYLWPVETLAYLLELELESQILGEATNNLAVKFSLPPAYEKAIVLSLAEDLQAPYGSPIDVSALAAKARAEMKGPNLAAPTLNLAAGVPTGSRGLPSFNYRTGSSR